jgi:hypothetical protein
MDLRYSRRALLFSRITILDWSIFIDHPNSEKI